MNNRRNCHNPAYLLMSQLSDLDRSIIFKMTPHFNLCVLLNGFLLKKKIILIKVCKMMNSYSFNRLQPKTTTCTFKFNLQAFNKTVLIIGA